MFFLLFIACSLREVISSWIVYNGCTQPIKVEESFNITLDITLPAFSSCEIEFEVNDSFTAHWLLYKYNGNDGDSLFFSDYTGYNISAIPEFQYDFTANAWFYVTTKLTFSSGAIPNARLIIEYRTQTQEILTQTALTIRPGNYVLARDNIEEFSPVVVEAAEAFTMVFIAGTTYPNSCFAVQGDFGTGLYLGRLSTLHAKGRLIISQPPYKLTIFRYTNYAGQYLLLGRTENDIEGFESYDFYSPFNSHAPIKPLLIKSSSKPAALTIAGQFGFWISEIEFLTNTTTLALYPAVQNDPFPPLVVYDYSNSTLHHFPQYLSSLVNTLIVAEGAVTLALTQQITGTHTTFSGTGSAVFSTPFYKDDNVNLNIPVSLTYRKHSDDYFDLVLYAEECDEKGDFMIEIVNDENVPIYVTLNKGDYRIESNINQFTIRYSIASGEGGLLKYEVVPTGSVTYSPPPPNATSSHNILLFFTLFLCFRS